MASLVITSLSFDKPVYNPGDVITLTVQYTSADFTGGSVTSEVAVTVADAMASASGSAPFAVSTGTEVPVPATVTVTDDRTPPGTWILVSDVLAGTSSPFAGTAVLTSVA